MCGRISLGTTAEALAQLFKLSDLPDIKPSWNIAPGQPIAVVRVGSRGQRSLSFLHWGLIPAWSKDRNIAYKLINARSDTVAEKPSFRSAYKSRRCLVPVDGFFEWQRQDKQKIPFHIRKRDSGLFALAGIWEHWKDKQSNEEIESCAILTTTANSLVQPIHNRMPVIINDANFDEWLTGDPLHLHRFLQPYEWTDFEAIQVSTYVNNARNDGRECIAAAQNDDIN